MRTWARKEGSQVGHQLCVSPLYLKSCLSIRITCDVYVGRHRGASEPAWSHRAAEPSLEVCKSCRGPSPTHSLTFTSISGVPRACQTVRVSSADTNTIGRALLLTDDAQWNGRGRQ